MPHRGRGELPRVGRPDSITPSTKNLLPAVISTRWCACVATVHDTNWLGHPGEDGLGIRTTRPATPARRLLLEAEIAVARPIDGLPRQNWLPLLEACQVADALDDIARVAATHRSPGGP